MKFLSLSAGSFQIGVLYFGAAIILLFVSTILKMVIPVKEYRHIQIILQSFI